MRTNIVLNDALVTEAMRYSEARTKRALVEEALETFVRVRAKEERDSEYWRRVAEIQNRKPPLQQAGGSHDLIRADRDR